MKWRNWLGSILCFGMLGLGLGYGLKLGNPGDSTAPGASSPFSPGVSALAQNSTTLPSTHKLADGSQRHTILVDVARKASPAVVSIGVTRRTYRRMYDPFGDNTFFSPFMIREIEEKQPYLGSGFIIDQEGHVITNFHVIEDATGIEVTLTDRRMFEAELLDADRYVDIALLKLKGVGPNETLPTLPLGNSDDMMIGETVLAIGNPFGPLLADPQPSVSMGVVSALKRSFRINQGDSTRIYEDCIQTDAAINPGNSGGPLVNLDGEAVGISTFIFSRSGDSASVGFSIPINRASRIVEEIKQYGQLLMIRKDFKAHSLTPYLVQTMDLPVERGAVIFDLEDNGPARRAGLREGDVIVEVEGRAIGSRDDLIAHFLARTAGEKIELTIVREGRRMTVPYTLMGVER